MPGRGRPDEVGPPGLRTSARIGSFEILGNQIGIRPVGASSGAGSTDGGGNVVRIRPITVMVGLAAVVAMVALTVSWLPDDDSATMGQPASLPIALGHEAASAMAP